MRIVWIVVTVFVAGVAYILGERSGQMGAEVSSEHGQIRVGESGFTNPLLECNYSRGVLDVPKKDVREVITRKIQGLLDSSAVSKFAFYYRDLNNGPVFGVNFSEIFHSWSLGKLPLSIATYKMSEDLPGVLKREVVFDRPRLPPSELDFLDKSTVLTVGKKYTVRELVELMLRFSDNQAAMLLSEIVAEKYIGETYKLLGIDGQTFESNKWGDVGVRQYSAYLRILYNSSFLSRINSAVILEILSKAEFDGGIKLSVPSNVLVSSKYGYGSVGGVVQMHECGIVYYPKKPYLVCMMTEGKELETLVSAIRDISRELYNELHKSDY